MKELQPVNQQVILDITENNSEKRTASGLIIPDSALKNPNRLKLHGQARWTNLNSRPETMFSSSHSAGTED